MTAADLLDFPEFQNARLQYQEAGHLTYFTPVLNRGFNYKVQEWGEPTPDDEGFRNEVLTYVLRVLAELIEQAAEKIAKPHPGDTPKRSFGRKVLAAIAYVGALFLRRKAASKLQ